MSVLISRIQRLLVCVALGAVAITGSATAQAADIYDSAARHPGRSAADLKRDALDHPADVLRLSNIGPGMRVADVLAGDGYYSELLSYIVGPRGHVLLLNNSAYDHWSDNGWQKRLAKLPNVVEVYPQVRFLAEVRMNGVSYSTNVLGLPDSDRANAADCELAGRCDRPVPDMPTCRQRAPSVSRRRLPPLPAFEPLGSRRANSPCTRSFPARPSRPWLHSCASSIRRRAT